MPDEIERKYLPADPDWRPEGRSNAIVQGYFWPGETVEARIVSDVRQVFSLVMKIRGDSEPWVIGLPAADGTLLMAASSGESLTGKWTLRVRRSSAKGGEFCIKGKAHGITRPEFEYPLSPADTEQLLQLCPNTHIFKHRYERPYQGFTWEVDVYDQPLPDEPKVLIEVELPTEQTVAPLPNWVGAEVSQDKRYTNANMARRRWQAAQTALAAK